MLITIQLPPSNYLITYYQTLDEVTWLLRQEKLKKDKCFQKFEKNCKFYHKISKMRKVKLLKTIPMKQTIMQQPF